MVVGGWRGRGFSIALGAWAGPAPPCGPSAHRRLPPTTTRRVYGSPQLDAVLDGSDAALLGVLRELKQAF